MRPRLWFSKTKCFVFFFLVEQCDNRVVSFSYANAGANRRRPPFTLLDNEIDGVKSTLTKTCNEKFRGILPFLWRCDKSEQKIP